MCMPKAPKPPATPQLPQAPQAADTAVVAARNSERRRTGAALASATTDVTGGVLAEASTVRKTALGQ